MNSERTPETIWRNAHDAGPNPVVGAIRTVFGKLAAARHRDRTALRALPKLVVSDPASASDGGGIAKPVKPVMRQINQDDIPELVNLIVNGFDPPRPREF